MRYASADAIYCVKEIDLAIVADIGTLQRLPKLIGEGRTRELAFTGKNISAQEGLDMGLVNAVFETKEEMMHHVSEIAIQIAQKSPLTVRGIKNVDYSQCSRWFTIRCNMECKQL